MDRAGLADDSGRELRLRVPVLTAARFAEGRLATWDEINRDSLIRTIPATRLNAKRERRVPLSGALRRFSTPHGCSATAGR